MKKDILKNINSPEDVKDFIEKNDKTLMEKIKGKQPLLKKAWEGLKTIISYGWKGFKFIVENWKEILIIVVLASCFIFGWETTATWIIKCAWQVIKYASSVIGKGVAEVAVSGEEISAANVAAGGFGGWTGMGLGGGLR